MSPDIATAATAFDVEAVRADFPALALEVHGKPLVYLDSAATAQKPRQVLEAMDRFLRESTANVHRGVHALAERATAAYEAARATVARHLGAHDPAEVVFLRGTTEAINLVAQAYLRPQLAAGDRILLTGLEHHSNIVPWQLVAAERQAEIAVAPIDERGVVDLEAFERQLAGGRVRLAAVAHVSNALGTVNPVREMSRLAHAHEVPILVDGAQAVPHQPVDVAALGCDFYAFSGHKAFGPTGIGALWARGELLADMPPWQGGGEMIRRVRFEGTTFAEAPARFEAGTPNIAGAVGLAAALDYLDGLQPDAIRHHEERLVAATLGRLQEIDGVRLIGTAPERAAVVSFVVDGVHAHDVGTVLDREGVAVRAGHHCAQPVMDRFGLPATVRASFALYNEPGEVDRLVAAVERARTLFA